MANPVNGQITVTVDIASTTEAGWKAAQKEVHEKVKEALEGIEIKAVEIDAASLSFAANSTLIESSNGTGADDDPDEKDEDAAASDDDSTEEPKKEKKSKKDKAAKGKKKGRK